MFTKSAQFYDAVYAWKDYAAESAQLHALIRDHKLSSGMRLLDVACGTAQHLQYLSQHYEVEGLDLDPDLLEVAAQRLPDVPFYCDDMRTFSLETNYDVVTCLFSAIGYVVTLEGLHQAIWTMTDHLEPGGVLIVEPWLYPEVFSPNSVHMHTVSEPELKIARIVTSTLEGSISVLDFNYLVGTPDGVQHLIEHHELGLFAHHEYLEALYASRLDVVYDGMGISGRGLYLGVKPL